MNANWSRSSLAHFDTLPGERIVAIDIHTAGEPLRIVLEAPFFQSDRTSWRGGAMRGKANGIAFGVCRCSNRAAKPTCTAQSLLQR